MLEYSGLSYSDDTYTEKGQQVYKVNDSATDVSYCVWLKCCEMAVVFRGSDSKKDWDFNLNFFKKVIPYGNKDSKIKVHGGFITAYKSRGVRGNIRSLVSEKIRKITLAGHSYGAALAVLCFIFLLSTRPARFPREGKNRFIPGTLVSWKIRLND